MRKILLVFFLVVVLLPFPTSAHWVVKENSVVCLTLSALEASERVSTGTHTGTYEKVLADKQCVTIKTDASADVGAIRMYSKVVLISYENKRKEYFVDTDDLKLIDSHNNSTTGWE